MTDDLEVREDVEQKRENTLTFLRFADDAAGAPMRAMNQHLQDRVAELLRRR